jgi:hypothetical protein
LFTAIVVIFAIVIAKRFLFSFGCRKFCCVSFAPFRSAVLKPNLELKEKNF